MNLSRLKRLVGTHVKVLRARFVHWTKPLTTSLPLGTIADLGRTKSELVAENALLRQQLIILKRQVKQPGGRFITQNPSPKDELRHVWATG